jgi:PST family polysaccharide transporter
MSSDSKAPVPEAADLQPFRDSAPANLLANCGGSYLAARYGLGVLVSLGNMLVLTWWIGPHAYGLFVTTIGLVAFLSCLARAGVDTYLVRHEPAPTTRSYDIAGTIVLVISMCLAIAGAALVPLLVRWYGSREFVAPYLVLLINIPVTGLTGIPTAKLERDLQFRAVAGFEVTGQCVGLVVSAILAWFGGGVWAAVAGQTVWQGFIAMAAYRRAGLVPRLRFEAREARAMLAYGIGLTASLRAWQLRTLVNPLLVGRFVGAEGVAFVALAIRTAEALGAVRLAAGRLAIAALARLRDRHEEFHSTLERALYLQVIVLGPLLVTFVLFGPFLMRHVIGQRWMPSLAVYPFVAAGVLVNSVYNLQASALFVMGRQWLVMRSYGAHVALLGIGTLILVPRAGIVGYGWAELLACGGYLLIHSGFAGARVISYKKLAPLVLCFFSLLFVPGASRNWTFVLWMALLSGMIWHWTQRSSSPRFFRILDRAPAKGVSLCLLGILGIGPAAFSKVHAQGLSEPIPSEFFGLHFRLDKISWPSVPFGALRLWDTDTRWQNLNPKPGVYDFTTLDRYLSAAQNHGVKDVLLTLSSTPAWASADPAHKRCDYEFAGPGDCAPPSDLNADGTGANQYWRDFLYNLGVHLATLDPRTYSPVSYFQIWNEFTRGAATPPSSWLGTNLQLQRMVQDANCILTGRGTITANSQPCTAANMHAPAVGLLPKARMVTPDAVPKPPDLFIYRDYLAQPGALDSLDVIAVHAYSYQSTGQAVPDSGPAGLPSLWSNTLAVLPANARGLLVWSTEGSWGDTLRRLPDSDLQVGYLARYFLVGWSIGFRRLYWYAADNSWGRLIFQNGIGGCHDQGSKTGCPTPATAAWTQVYQWMVGNRMTSPCANAATRSIWTCGLTKPDGTKMLAVWDASQTCLHGACTTTAFAYPPGYQQYFTLSNSVPHTLVGGTVLIGWKPILLSQ